VVYFHHDIAGIITLIVVVVVVVFFFVEAEPKAEAPLLTYQNNKNTTQVQRKSHMQKAE